MRAYILTIMSIVVITAGLSANTYAYWATSDPTVAFPGATTTDKDQHDVFAQVYSFDQQFVHAFRLCQTSQVARKRG